MTNIEDRGTRNAADLVDSTAADGARQSCSAIQQFVPEISGQQSVARQRGEAALESELQLRELSAEESVVFNAEIAAAIKENLASSNYGELLANRGVTTVALDEAGDIIEHRPDGSLLVPTEKRKPSRRKRVGAPPPQ